MSFDPEQFLDAALTQPLTKRPPADASRPYPAVIGEPKQRNWSGEDKEGHPAKASYMDFPLTISLPQDVAEKVGQNSIIVTHSVRLTLTVDEKGLDMSPGKNPGLRLMYEATDLNRPGSTPRMLQGRMITVILKHDLARDGSGDMYERVASLAKG